MIRITNQEEFKKCCEMCNSKDIESRLLGLSLLEECVEHLNCGTLCAKLEYIDKSVDLYEWPEFIKIGINAINYKFGDDLYGLISRGFYLSTNGLKMTLIDYDYEKDCYSSL